MTTTYHVTRTVHYDGEMIGTSRSKRVASGELAYCNEVAARHRADLDEQDMITYEVLDANWRPVREADDGADDWPF